MGADSPGTTGVKAARLIARRANSSRAVNIIARIVSHLEIFATQVDGLGELCYLIVDAEEDRDFADDDRRADDVARLRFGSDLHCFRFTSAKGVQSRVLREQIVLLDFNQENCSSFATVCQKRCGF